MAMRRRKNRRDSGSQMRKDEVIEVVVEQEK